MNKNIKTLPLGDQWRVVTDKSETSIHSIYDHLNFALRQIEENLPDIEKCLTKLRETGAYYGCDKLSLAEVAERSQKLKTLTGTEQYQISFALSLLKDLLDFPLSNLKWVQGYGVPMNHFDRDRHPPVGCGCGYDHHALGADQDQ